MGLFGERKNDVEKNIFSPDDLKPSDGHTHILTVRVPINGMMEDSKVETHFDVVVDNILKQIEEAGHNIVDIKFANSNYSHITVNRAMIIYR